MYQWTDVYVDTYLKERIDEVMKTQKNLAGIGQVLCSTYEQLWLPAVGSLPDVEYAGQERYRAPYGNFQPVLSHPFHGALAFLPKSGVDLPPELRSQIEWQGATATLDLGGRVVKIEVGDTEITFTSVNVHLKPHELLRDINRELVRSEAGVYVWQITPLLDAPSIKAVLQLDALSLQEFPHLAV